jgi:hypothetical protein
MTDERPMPIGRFPMNIAALREHPPHLAKLDCGHVMRFVLSPIKDWAEWCHRCTDFRIVVDGV